MAASEDAKQREGRSGNIIVSWFFFSCDLRVYIIVIRPVVGGPVGVEGVGVGGGVGGYNF